jgi:predicted lipoprotein with Yx(FWY)xxD motif
MLRATLISSLALGALCACGGGSSGGSTNPAAAPNLPAAPAPAAPATAAPVASAPLATATLNGSAGFVNGAGHTVYVFDADLATPGQSACNGACAQNWPPVVPPAGVALVSPWSSITRADSSLQLAYAGRPLYAFIADAQAGQTNGDGLVAFGGTWHIARPAAATAAPTTAPTSPPGMGGGY